jgi:cytochrome c-type biogenesis protein
VNALPPGRVARALALGAFVAIGWTPCIGPVLGTILTMGASSKSAPVALLLLTAYSAGLALPFLAAALALPRLRPVIGTLRRHHRLVEVVAGLFIMGMGVLIFANAFWRMQSAFSFFL